VRERFRLEEWHRCPDAALRDAWLDDLVALWNYTREGQLRDIEPHPSAAVFSGFAVLTSELRDREAALAKRAEAAREAERASAKTRPRRRGGA
jgi:hypothetical protein